MKVGVDSGAKTLFQTLPVRYMSFATTSRGLDYISSFNPNPSDIACASMFTLSHSLCLHPKYYICIVLYYLCFDSTGHEHDKSFEAVGPGVPRGPRLGPSQTISP